MIPPTETDTCLPAGWHATDFASDTLRFEEFASTDLGGKPLDVSGRDRSAKQLTPTFIINVAHERGRRGAPKQQ